MTNTITFVEERVIQYVYVKGFAKFKCYIIGLKTLITCLTESNPSIEDHNKLLKYRSCCNPLTTISNTYMNCNQNKPIAGGFSCFCFSFIFIKLSNTVYISRLQLDSEWDDVNVPSELPYRRNSSDIFAICSWSLYFIVLCLNFYLKIIKSQSNINIFNFIYWEVDNTVSNKTGKIH